MKNPKISVVIVSYNMAKEIARTISSFLPGYQRELDEEDVEIIVIENGSTSFVGESIVESWPSTVKYLRVEDAPPSPAWALNAGADIARGRYICPVIDGARLATPRLLCDGLTLATTVDRAFVTCLGYHLGSKPQQLNPSHDRKKDAELLERVNWPQEPYRLFEVASLGLSARAGFFGSTSEANAPILPKELWNELGGFDEKFSSPGGGYVNLDFYKRAVELPDVQLFQLINEGTFHQFHGGRTTTYANSVEWDRLMKSMNDEYFRVRGRGYSLPDTEPVRYGILTKMMERALFNMAQHVSPDA